jgi:hypothetical protein
MASYDRYGPTPQARICVFSGGTAFNSVCQFLARLTPKVRVPTQSCVGLQKHKLFFKKQNTTVTTPLMLPNALECTGAVEVMRVSGHAHHHSHR